MKVRTRAGSAAVIAFCGLLGVAFRADGQTTFSSAQSSEKRAAVTKHATGTFDVKMTPQPADENAGEATTARFILAKQFHGDLEATSKGQMLTAGTAQSSGAYVAIERVTGRLNGRAGSFTFQ